MSAAVDVHADPENPHAGQGSVLLDIGGEIGALVVTMPPDTVGQEIEIRPEGAPDHPADHQHGHSHGHAHYPHVAVVNRPTAGGQHVPSLVFGELAEGRYELYPKETRDVRLRVEVLGGQVATAEWPT